MPNTKQTKVKVAARESIHPGVWIHAFNCKAILVLNTLHHFWKRFNHQTNTATSNFQKKGVAEQDWEPSSFPLPPEQGLICTLLQLRIHVHLSWSEKGEKHQTSKFIENPVSFKLW